MSKRKLTRIIAISTIATIAVAVTGARLLTPVYTLTVSVSPSEAGSVSPTGGVYRSGAIVELTATPDCGYSFDRWSGSASSAAPTIAVTMDSDKSITAHIKEDFTLSVTVSPTGGGDVSPSGGVYQSGLNATLTVRPAWGYMFDCWSGDATGSLSSITINMSSNKDVTAQFRMFFSAELSRLATGIGVPKAAAYQGSAHPVVLISSTGEIHKWSDELPLEWLPTTVEDTQLVVCVREEREKAVQVCKYFGPDITRYQYYLSVTLMEAKTGNTVAATTLYGSLPRACLYTEDYWLTRLAGSHVSFDQLREWLHGHVVTSG